MVKEACVGTKTKFKEDPLTWGVTRNDDPRLTSACFDDYKSEQRKHTEELLRKYMCEPSSPRAPELADFTIAVTVAAPGTGKTRLLDDALRMPLDSKHFEHYLRLAITFNGFTGGVFAHPVAARFVREFFCGAAATDSSDVLRAIDTELSVMFQDENIDRVARRALDALEALYFQERGGKLGRTVLMIDEISKARIRLADVTDTRDAEDLVYRTVVTWVDQGRMVEHGVSRRGAVFTALTIVSSWAVASPASSRKLVWLPLGVFDVWDAAVQGAITSHAKTLWADLDKIPQDAWSLLAATGGRPRDIDQVLGHLKAQQQVISTADTHALLSALYAVAPEDQTFAHYLLPSLLGINFDSFMRGTIPTQFGLDATSSALLNSDQLATKEPAVPAVSLRYIDALPEGDDARDDLRLVVRALVSTLVFYKLDSTGKDFERAWVLLVFCVLQLQHLVRTDALTSFWPKIDDDVKLGGPARPASEKINVFASNNRLEALFARPDDDRVYEAPNSTIHRKLMLRKVPTLALWQDLWAPTVEAGSEVPDDWPRMMKLDVEWRPSSLVFFENNSTDNVAIDFMLMVGEAGGTGDNEPHVYMFQCKALTKKNVAQSQLTEIVRTLNDKLNDLFGEPYASTHVLRLAGIQSARQVTLCVAALNLGVKVNLKALGAPFNIVLFDSDDFRGLGGAAFRGTRFFRNLSEM